MLPASVYTVSSGNPAQIQPLVVDPPRYGEFRGQGFLHFKERMMKAAILVDGGYYRKIAPSAFDCSDPKVASADLVNYCMRHLKDKRGEFDLYRIFYYDCPPLSENVYHPFLKKTINMGKTDQHQWMTEFLKELTKKRKLALRLGRLSEWEAAFTLRHDKVKN